MEHRGACSADDDSGDGAGLMTQIPWKLLAKDVPGINEATTGCVAQHSTAHSTLHIALHLCLRAPAASRPLNQPLPPIAPSTPACSVGMLFMPNDDALEAQARSLLEESVSAEGLTLLGYRQVPVDHAVVGRFARDTQPRIAQVFVQGKPGQTGDDLERQLFLVRKRLEQAKAAAMGDAAQDFYVCTLSNRTIVYKVRVCACRRCTACTGCTCSGLWCCRGRARLDGHGLPAGETRPHQAACVYAVVRSCIHHQL